ncbi:MAG: B12-binding domain-containing radical SAM protein [Chitinispirillaceae bacterium]
MPKTALIINPYITDFKLYDEWMHPLGLYFLIQFLQEKGFDTHYINCLERSAIKKKRYNTSNFLWREISKPQLYESIQRKYKLYGLCPEDFKTRLSQIKSPDVIFLGSMMTYWLPGVSETIKFIRSVFPHPPIVVGGAAVRLFGHYFSRHHPDVITADKEFETAGIQFTSSIYDKAWKPKLTAGLKSAGNILHGPVLTCLGCPLSCSYCAAKKLQPRFLIRPHETVKEEILYLIHSKGIRDFAFYDDALLVLPEKTLFPLENTLDTFKKEIRFHTPNGLHLKNINKETIASLKSLNTKTLRFGYETADNRFQDSTGGKVTLQMLEEKSRLLHEAGMHKNAGVYMMAGLPDQTPEDMLREMDTVSSTGLKVKPVFYSPVPGTPLFNYYSKHFPQLHTNPLWHNDTFFLSRVSGWGCEAMETVRQKAKELNGKLF